MLRTESIQHEMPLCIDLMNSSGLSGFTIWESDAHDAALERTEKNTFPGVEKVDVLVAERFKDVLDGNPNGKNGLHCGR